MTNSSIVEKFLFSFRNPNQNSDGDVVESEWEPFTLTEPYMKELKPKLGNLIGFRASYCAMHNNLIPNLITNTGT